jgi:hypothetical protein
VKTTLEIPDTLFRQAKSAAAERGIPFRELVSQALAEKLRTPRSVDRPWMKAFGKLSSLHKETARIQRVIDDEFEHIDAEDWS